MTIKQPAYDPLLRAVGHLVQMRRCALGISQEELARRANLHRTYVSDVERGSRSVSLITLCKIAEALDTHAHLLIQDPELQHGKMLHMNHAPQVNPMSEFFREPQLQYGKMSENLN